MAFRAEWIWTERDEPHPYNQAIVARQRFTCGEPQGGRLRIAADSWYRVLVNGEWIGDGPCRAWPEHTFFDEHDVSHALQAGENTIEILARYWGCGTFHQLPRLPGVLAELEVDQADGARLVVGTGADWEAAEARWFISATPKVSIQMEPAELVDARLRAGPWGPARVVAPAEGGPWSGLARRDVALLGRTPVGLRRWVGAQVVAGDWLDVTFPAARLAHPGVIEANGSASMAGAVATLVCAERAMTLALGRDELNPLRILVNGAEVGEAGAALQEGENLLVALFNPGGHMKDQGFRFVTTAGFTLANPLCADAATPWAYAPLGEAGYVESDIHFFWAPTPERLAARAACERDYATVAGCAGDAGALRRLLVERARPLGPEELLCDPHRQFAARRPLGDGGGRVTAPAALMHDNAEWTVVEPDPAGDLELCYDLGAETVGYLEFDLIAPEGTVVDLFGVEYMDGDGRIQHTMDNRNGLRYTCSAGRNRFVSTKRRALRYLFVTLRGQTAPVRLRLVRVIESTYPVEAQGGFTCSDADLTRIWEISAHTLKLCMEDTFTDCPLYEQTLWVGDARNESLFGMTAFGAWDLARRCIRLTGQSLERYPITGCQVPSAWDCLLPAWSFMWGISVWEYYEHTGDRAFLAECWPWVAQNLRGAEGLLDERGLFSGPFWNMFDWTGVDGDHATLLHNSLFLIGAIAAAICCAGELGHEAEAQRLGEWHGRLTEAVNALWDADRQTYPDGVMEDGSISPKSCMHTSFLALLYDVVPAERRAAALRNCLTPPEGMTPVGSPFAIQFLYEALEKCGRADAVIDSIVESYGPMLRLGATTVWEQFAGGSFQWGGWPTRSHCHAWSSAPVYFLNRIVLGIRPEGVGGRAFVVSPRVDRADWAEGATATPLGPVRVRWEKAGGTLRIRVGAPAGVAVRYAANDTHAGLRIEFGA